MKCRKRPGQRLPAPAAPEPAPAPEPEPAPEPAPEPEPPPDLTPEPPPDPNDEVNNLICVLRDQLRRADGFATSAEKELVESWGVGDDDSGEDEDGDDSVQRRRCRVEDLVEAAKLAVREAQYTSDQLAAELAAQRRGA